MRKRLWQLHFWCGLIAGLGPLLIGLSGSILVFHDEVDRLLDPALRGWSPPAGRNAVVVRRVVPARPDAVTRI